MSRSEKIAPATSGEPSSLAPSELTSSGLPGLYPMAGPPSGTATRSFRDSAWRTANRGIVAGVIGVRGGGTESGAVRAKSATPLLSLTPRPTTRPHGSICVTATFARG
ncbi:MAG: hypothetical protein ACM37U_07475, partial [Gemmatimonas sp.]